MRLNGAALTCLPHVTGAVGTWHPLCSCCPCPFSSHQVEGHARGMPGISPGASQALMITCSRVGQGQALGWGRMGQAGDQNSREHRSQGCLAQVPQGTTWEPVRQARVIHVHGWQAPRRQHQRSVWLSGGVWTGCNWGPRSVRWAGEENPLSAWKSTGKGL